MDQPKGFVTPAVIGLIALFALEAAALVALTWPVEQPDVDGIMVRAGDALIEVADQATWSSVTVERVLTPTDSWLMVQRLAEDGTPAEVIGVEPVRSGETTGVTVRIARGDQLPEQVAVTLVADRGKPGEFESAYGPVLTDRPAAPGMDTGMGAAGEPAEQAEGGMGGVPDKPLLADGSVISARARLSSFQVDAGGPRMDAAELTEAGDKVIVSRVAAPEASWVAVTTQTEDTATVLGYVPIPAGESVGIEVPISAAPAGKTIMAWLHADLANGGRFDYRASDYANSPDPAYFDGAWYVAVPVALP